MVALCSVIVLVALVAGPAGATTVYQNDDPAYPTFEVNAQTQAHPATTWAEQAAESLAKLAGTPTGMALQIAAGLYGVLVSRSTPVTQATINF